MRVPPEVFAPHAFRRVSSEPVPVIVDVEGAVAGDQHRIGCKVREIAVEDEDVTG